MPKCKNCKKDGRAGRDLVELPEDIFKGKNPQTGIRHFKKTGAALVCPHCDGETLIETALRNHQAREQEQDQA